LSAGAVIAILMVPLAVSPWGMNQFGPSKLFAVAVAAASVGLALAIEPAAFATAMKDAVHSPLAWALAAYVGVASLSTATSVDRLHSVIGSYPEYQGLATLILWAVIAIGAALLVRRESGWQQIARAVIVALITVATIAWLQKAGVPTVGGPGGWSKRAWSTIGNSSHLGVWLVLALPFSAERFLAEKPGGWRVAAVLSGVLGVTALALSGSRGAMVGFAASLVVGTVLIARERPRAQRVRIGLAGAGAIALATAVTLLTQGRFERLSGFLDVSKGSAGWRFVVWQTALRIAKDRPVLGWGLNSMRFVYPSYRSTSALDSPINMGTVADMHNIVLNTAASLGIAGVIALAACVAMAAMAVWRAGAAQERDWILAATAGASLSGFFAAVLFHYPALDSGALAAVVVGALLSVDARRAVLRAGTTVPAPLGHTSGRMTGWRIGASVLSAVLVVATFAAGALAGADIFAARAQNLAESGAPWVQTRETLRQARSLAPWELAFRKIWATTGIATMRHRSDQSIAPDVAEALDGAQRIAPLDPSIAGARGDLMLQAAKAGAKTSNLKAAERAYRQATERDPNNAVYWAGIGAVQYARGDYSQAVTTFQRVVTLAQDSPQMWRALAQAYRSAGRLQDARNAETQALDIGAQ